MVDNFANLAATKSVLANCKVPHREFFRISYEDWCQYHNQKRFVIQNDECECGKNW